VYLVKTQNVNAQSVGFLSRHGWASNPRLAFAPPPETYGAIWVILRLCPTSVRVFLPEGFLKIVDLPLDCVWIDWENVNKEGRNNIDHFFQFVCIASELCILLANVPQHSFNVEWVSIHFTVYNVRKLMYALLNYLQ